MSGPEYCMNLHCWARSRGRCKNIEVKSFEGKAVTIATTFNTHGSPNIAYRDTFFLADGSVLALSHTSDCLWTLDQARVLVDAIAAAATLNELPAIYSHIDGPKQSPSPRARVDPARGGEWIYTICSERLQREMREQAESNGFPALPGQTEEECTLQWCCRRFEWSRRARAKGYAIAGFRGFQVVHCDRTHDTGSAESCITHSTFLHGYAPRYHYTE